MRHGVTPTSSKQTSAVAVATCGSQVRIGRGGGAGDRPTSSVRVDGVRVCALLIRLPSLLW
eukprot:3677754-Alexandrium_andersonii.AAC.1